MQATDFHKQLYKNLVKKTASFVASKNAELKRYETTFKKMAKRPFELKSIETILKETQNINLLYIADFHTYAQNVRNLLRLIRSPQMTNRSLTIGVEFIQAKHQEHLDNYLMMAISEGEFLESIDYEKTWNFPWSAYSELLIYARENKIPVIALNSLGTLCEREEKASQLIAQELIHTPENLIVVLFGELHLGPDKLPLKVSTTLEKNNFSAKHIIIHQNIDDVFWKLEAKKKNSMTSVISFSKNEYSLQNAPPWAKLESLAYWYENLAEDPEFSFHEYLREKGLLKKAFGYNEALLILLTGPYETLQLSSLIKKEDLENFNLLGVSEIPVALKKLDKYKLKPFINVFNHLITTGQSFRIPGTSDYFYPYHSQNRLAYVAGLHLGNLISLNTFPSDLFLTDSNNLKENTLCYFFYESLFGILVTLFINPYRKCELYQDLLNSQKSSNSRSLAINLTEHFLILLSEKTLLKYKRLLSTMTLIEICEAGILLGHICGHELYREFLRPNPNRALELKEVLIELEANLKHLGETLAYSLGGAKLSDFKKRNF